MDSEAERELFRRLAALEARVADLEEANRIIGLEAARGSSTGLSGVPDASNGTGAFRWVERGGRKFEVREGEDPEEVYRFWMSLDPPPGPESA